MGGGGAGGYKIGGGGGGGGYAYKDDGKGGCGGQDGGRRPGDALREVAEGSLIRAGDADGAFRRLQRSVNEYLNCLEEQ